MIRPIESIIAPYMARKTESPALALKAVRQGANTYQPRPATFGVREPAFDRSKRRG